MKKLSQQRKETDIEYDEKRTNLTLTQAELDRENDYYMRPASPIRDNSEEEDLAEDVPRLRRIAPPPPPEFQSRPTRRYPSPPNRRYDRSPSPPSSRVRRVAPPRSPPGPGGPRHRRGDEWADPWMRDTDQGRRSRPRKRSYSSGSSRSSSRSSSSRSRSRSPKRRRRRRSSSGSSKSSRSRRSRSRSSTPEGIPRRNNRDDDSPVNRNTAPLQKRLMSLASTSNPAKLNIKKEPEDKKSNLSAADAALAKSNRSRKSSRSSSASSRSSSRSSSPSSSRRRKSNSMTDQPKEMNTELAPSTPPPEEAQDASTGPAAPKPQIKMAFKPSAVSKATNKNVLEKLGNDSTEILENAKAKREENKLKKASEIKKEKKDKKKSTADRREELLKQLKAVENAIAKKRTKINEKN